MTIYEKAYVIGDIHGYHDQLIRLQKIIDDDSKQSKGKKILIYLGDYIDRGPSIKDCIQSLIDFKPPNFTIVYLLGNHEQMLLNFLANKKNSLYVWINNGGRETLNSYGNKMEQYVDESMQLEFNDKILDNFLISLSDTHKKFFYELKFFYEWQNFFFVHAGIDPSMPLSKQTKETMLWSRNENFLDSNLPFEKIIIHGHTASKKIIQKNNRICLDTGVFFSGILSGAKITATNKIEFFSTY